MECASLPLARTSVGARGRPVPPLGPTFARRSPLLQKYAFAFGMMVSVSAAATWVPVVSASVITTGVPVVDATVAYVKPPATRDAVLTTMSPAAMLAAAVLLAASKVSAPPPV